MWMPRLIVVIPLPQLMILLIWHFARLSLMIKGRYVHMVVVVQLLVILLHVVLVLQVIPLVRLFRNSVFSQQGALIHVYLP